MIYFARKVLPQIAGNWTFLIVTDRIDLDDQIYQNFAGQARSLNPKKKPAYRKREHLRQMLADEDHRYVFTRFKISQLNVAHPPCPVSAF